MALSPRLPLALVAAVAVLAPASPATAQISAPETVVDWKEGILSPVAAASTGRAVAGWLDYRSRVLRVSVRGADRAWGPPTSFSAAMGESPPEGLELAVDPDGGPVAAFNDFGGGVAVWTGGDVGRIGGGYTGLQYARLAAGGDLGTLAAWFGGDTGTAAKRTFASLRPRGGSFPDAVGLSVPGALPRALASAVSSTGDAVVAWTGVQDGVRRIQYALRAPGGGFGPVATIDTASPEATTAAALPDGTLLLAWRETPAGGEPRVMLATRAPGGVFGAPEVAGPSATPRLAAGPDGTAALQLAVGTEVRVAVRPPGGSFGEPVTVVPSTRSAATTVAPDGSVAVVWSDEAGVAAAVRRPGESFGPGISLSGREGEVVASEDLLLWREMRLDENNRMEARLRAADVLARPSSTPQAPQGDTTAPQIAARLLDIRAHRGRVRVLVACSEVCRLDVTGKLARRAVRPYRATLRTPFKFRTVRVRLPRRKKRGSLRLRLRAADLAGNVTTERISVRLR